MGMWIAQYKYGIDSVQYQDQADFLPLVPRVDASQLCTTNIPHTALLKATYTILKK